MMKSFKQELRQLDDPKDRREYLSKQRHVVSILGRTYEHFKPQLYKLDQKFLRIVGEIEPEYRLLFYSKPDQVRIEQWVRKLCENCCERIPLMKNRNKYIKLLRICIFDIKRLEGIFKKMPPTDGDDLKQIQNHEILDIEQFAQKIRKNKKNKMRAQEMYNYNQQKARQVIGESKLKLREQQELQQPIVVESNRTRNARHNFQEYFSIGSTSARNQTPNGAALRNYKSLSSLGSDEKFGKTIFSQAISPIGKNYQGARPKVDCYRNKTPIAANRISQINLISQRSKSFVNLELANKRTVPKINTQTLETNYFSARSQLSNDEDQQQKSRRSRAERNADARSKCSSRSSRDQDYFQKNLFALDNINEKAFEPINFTQTQKTKDFRETRIMKKYIPEPNFVATNYQDFKRKIGQIAQQQMKSPKSSKKSVQHPPIVNIQAKKAHNFPQIKVEALDERNSTDQSSDNESTKENDNYHNRDLDSVMPFRDIKQQNKLVNDLARLREETNRLLAKRALILRN